MPNAAANLADSSPFPSELLKLHHATNRSQSQSPRQIPIPPPRRHFQPARATIFKPNAYLQQALGWSSVQQVFRITRECTWSDRTTGEHRTSRETDSGITSLPRHQSNAARLLELNRNHWRIENSVFYVRDETLGEDRIRTRSGPQVLAALRNATLSLLRMTGSTNISASLRSCSWNIQLVKKLLAIV